MRSLLPITALCAVCLAAPASGQSRSDTTRTAQDTVFLLEPITVEGRVDNLTGQASTASVGTLGTRISDSAPFCGKANSWRQSPE
jgi:hypothetical protein